MLSQFGHTVHFAASGSEAVEAVSAEGNAFDLILMDVRMPGMSGPDATRAIRQMGGAYNKLPIIAVTADVTESNISAYLEAGMNAYATKPIHQEALLTTINEVLGEEVHRFTDPPPGSDKDEVRSDGDEKPISSDVKDFLATLDAASSE